MSPPSGDPAPKPIEHKPGDASRRTQLAGERTRLAWWRTGFAVLAVGLAVAKIVPQLSSEETIWPYTILGAAFGLYAVLLMIHGSVRGTQVDAAVATGSRLPRSRPVETILTVGATLLALATTLVIILS